PSPLHPAAAGVQKRWRPSAEARTYAAATRLSKCRVGSSVRAFSPAPAPSLDPPVQNGFARTEHRFGVFVTGGIPRVPETLVAVQEAVHRRVGGKARQHRGVRFSEISL